MAEPTDEALRAALESVPDASGGRDIVAAGRVLQVQVRGGLVQVSLGATREEAPSMEKVRRAAEAALARVPGVRNATVVLTAHREAPAAPTPAGRPAPAALFPEVGAVIAVASGKGGVGKSTTAVNLAVAFAALGLRTGLLDADIYGPSLPRMVGQSARPELRGEVMQPVPAWGLATMSIGYLVEERTPMIWRGPMVMGALEQLMGQVAWGALDVLVVDMPPGTGDTQLTIAQRVRLAGAVIVSTPQDIALLDARRGVAMFQKTGVPVLGLVENMSAFACPHCGEVSHVFGHGGARREAETLGVPFLGEVPLLLDIRESADSGAPVMATSPDSAAGRAYRAIAEALLPSLGAPPPGPRISVA